jgi:hypothetical protein
VTKSTLVIEVEPTMDSLNVVLGRTLALDILRGITDPVQAAEAYRRVFGECCGTEQLMLLLNANTSTPSN